jgi:hypothetical protein
MLMNAARFQRKDAEAQRISTTDGPSARGEFALHFEFAELRFAVGVGNRAGTQAVALMAMIQFNSGKTFQIQLALKLFGGLGP